MQMPGLRMVWEEIKREGPRALRKGSKNMIEVRKANAGEETAIISFYADLIEIMRNNEFRPTWEVGIYPTIDTIRDAIAANTLYVAVDTERGDHIVSAGICNHNQGEGYETVPWKVDAAPEKVSVIHLLGVDPRLQHQGIGRKVIQAMIADCKAQGDLAIRLDALPWNKPARALYEGCGFVLCGSLPMVYPPRDVINFSMYEYAVQVE